MLNGYSCYAKPFFNSFKILVDYSLSTRHCVDKRVQKRIFAFKKLVQLTGKDKYIHSNKPQWEVL